MQARRRRRNRPFWIAHQVEQQTANLCVAGSNPAPSHAREKAFLMGGRRGVQVDGDVPGLRPGRRPRYHPVPGFVPARIPARRATKRRFFQVRAMARPLWKRLIADRLASIAGPPRHQGTSPGRPSSHKFPATHDGTWRPTREIARGARSWLIPDPVGRGGEQTERHACFVICCTAAFSACGNRFGGVIAAPRPAWGRAEKEEDRR